MRRLVFETHATSIDNEAGRASGWHDVHLSATGERQAAELGARYADDTPSIVLTSDLRRAWRTAMTAFGGRVAIHRDARLRECDYGQLTLAPAADIARMRRARVDTPFPGGESYVQVVARVRACLADVATIAPDGWLLVVGHRATQYALDHLLAGVPLHDAVVAPWQWQPGWTYWLPEPWPTRVGEGEHTPLA